MPKWPLSDPKVTRIDPKMVRNHPETFWAGPSEKPARTTLSHPKWCHFCPKKWSYMAPDRVENGSKTVKKSSWIISVSQRTEKPFMETNSSGPQSLCQDTRFLLGEKTSPGNNAQKDIHQSKSWGHCFFLQIGFLLARFARFFFSAWSRQGHLKENFLNGRKIFFTNFCPDAVKKKKKKTDKTVNKFNGVFFALFPRLYILWAQNKDETCRSVAGVLLLAQFFEFWIFLLCTTEFCRHHKQGWLV